jgi:putative ABC transport system permease protein
MADRAYRLLLRVLPAGRRRAYGDAMAAVFDQLVDEAWRARGVGGVLALWIREMAGMFQFAVRDRLAAMFAGGAERNSAGSPGGRFAHDLRWAWRGVRTRGARAILIIALLGVALAANTVMFSVADSLVFDRAPYRDVARLIEIQSIRSPGSTGDRLFTTALLDEWRKQTDLFVSVQGYLSKTVFLTSDGGAAELVPATDVTIGLIDLLGVRPKWGRTFLVGDDEDASAQHVLISEALARHRFGEPDRALGQRLESTTGPMLIVGVMSSSFRFPQGSSEIWRALDPRGPLMAGFGALSSIARIAPGVSIDALRAAMTARSPAIGEAGRKTPYLAAPGPFYLLATPQSQRTLFLILLGAALCLWASACANVASIELIGAVHRARTYAVQLSLGASRGALARVALVEGAWLVGGAVIAAIGLSLAATRLLPTLLPDGIRLATGKPIDLDWRAMVFLTGLAMLTWMVASLPIVLFASRARLTDLLKVEDRGAAVSRGGSRVRRALTVVEIALAVPLVVGGVLYARSYLGLVAADKGFDSSNLADVTMTVPMQYYPAGMRALADDLAATLRRVPGVIAATRSAAPPSLGDSPSQVHLEIDGRPPDADTAIVGRHTVDADYFTVVAPPVLSGRTFVSDEPTTSAIVPVSFAKRFWPSEDAVGHAFRLTSSSPWLRVVGVVGDIRNDPRPLPEPLASRMYYYVAVQPPQPSPPSALSQRVAASGGTYGRPSVSVRLDDRSRAAAVLAAAQSVDRRLRAELRFVDDVYATQFADVLLATRVVIVFGTLAFFVAIVGVYSAMAFLVAGRTREIGIRMALGAQRGDVTRLVLTSAMRLVVIGAGLGLCVAALASHSARAQIFGVSASDPWTYLLVTAAVIITAIVATWQPARHAAHVDPAITLRME